MARGRDIEAWLLVSFGTPAISMAETACRLGSVLFFAW